MTRTLLRLAAGTATVVAATLTLTQTVSAHSSAASATCDGITTSLQFFENAAGDRVYTSIDGTLVDTFNGPFVTTTHTVPVPQDGAAHSWQVVVDSVSGNGGTQYDATYNGQVGPCGTATTTTEASTTSTSTSTTLVAETTTTTAPVTTTSTTSVPATTSEPTTTLAETTTTGPTTTSSVATTSTSSPSVSTTTPASTAPSTSSPAPSSTTPECSDNPNTPTDECNPICEPVEADINGDGDTSDAGENSCYRLPATGAGNTVAIIIAAWIAILAGIIALGYGAAHRDR